MTLHLYSIPYILRMFGHVINDVLLYQAHTYFAWSLVRIGINRGMVTSTSTSRHLSPSLDEDVLASWTTLFEGGGDDVAQPTSITRTNHPTHAKSPWASKVNSFLFEISFPTLWNGMLLEHPPLCIARFDTMDTKPMGGAEEAQELISSKAYAWMRRRSVKAKAQGRSQPA